MVSDRFKCHRCKKPFRDSYALQAHSNRKIKCKAPEEVVEEQKWYCETCKQSCSTKAHLLAHFKTKSHARLTNGLETGDSSNSTSTTENGDLCQVMETERFIRLYNVEAFKKFRIRKSCEKPYKFHALDLIASVTGLAFGVAETLFNRLKNVHSELVALCETTNFGTKKGAIGVDLSGVIQIINVLPGEKAAKFRDDVCDDFVS